MSHQLSLQVSRKRARETDDDDVILAAISFIILVVGALYDQIYRVKEVTWNPSERVMKRAMWMGTLKNDRICKEQLRINLRCFEKLCIILESKGGLKTTRYVNVKEIVALFLHTLAHDLKNRTMQALFAWSGETVSRQFHAVLQAVLKIGKFYIRQNRIIDYTRDKKWKWFEVI